MYIRTFVLFFFNNFKIELLENRKVIFCKIISIPNKSLKKTFQNKYELKNTK